MPRINWYNPEEYDDSPIRETIRRNTDPVNGRHDLQRRSENAVNRAERTARREAKAAAEDREWRGSRATRRAQERD